MGITEYTRLSKGQRRLVSILLGGYLVLLLNSLLLLLFESSTAGLYMTMVLLHIGLGFLIVLPVTAFLVLHVRAMPRKENPSAAWVGIGTALSLVVLLATGTALAVWGAAASGHWVLVTHIVTAVTSILFFILHVSLKYGAKYHFLEWGHTWRQGAGEFTRHPLSITVLTGVLLSVTIAAFPMLGSTSAVYVEGESEADLMLSQAVLAHDGFLDPEDLGRAESCGQAGCHPDVYAQWEESVHHFSSFNNPWYRKSIEVLVERKGNEPAAWCASCHDPQVLYTGGMVADKPIDMDHWTAKEGLTCLSCHAIEGLQDVKGNGRYVISKPDEYPFARAEDGVGKWLHTKLIKTKPEAHRAAMLKPVHKTDEFCGSCHKVGLPPEVNHYKWKRGQNQYDSWHASGVSGNTVRSFYLPPKPVACASCHMPLVPSDDMGNDGGYIRSHRFAAANTAVPFLNGHADQQAAVIQALQDSIVTVDLFMVTVNGVAYGPEDDMPLMRTGDKVELSAVVRNRKVGHRFPAGTNDSNEIWLQLLARDEAGNPVLSSGTTDALGRVDSTAHFFGAVLVDQAGNEINKRNAQDWMARVYANVINPGTARTVHYNFTVPRGTSIASLEMALQHRKFKWYFNEYSFRGRLVAGQPDSLKKVEVELREHELGPGDAPDIPITTMATVQRTAGTPYTAKRPLWERWNDYGIGLLLEGDTKTSILAFEKVAQLEGNPVEGFINQARVLLEEGQIDRARDVLKEAEGVKPGYLKTAYFEGQVHKANADYNDALAVWERVADAYPGDRVLLLDIARIHYLNGDYERMLPWLDRVLEIDPEHVGALYNRMLAVGALGMDDELEEARRLYLYHKDNEDELTITATYKKQHPMANREAQSIHIHELKRYFAP
ncbi:MAG: tetratricopeptide repeat protein, partial [Bacteroidota bacterium]